jgi:hypothetical protein
MSAGRTFRERVHDARAEISMITPREAKALLDQGGVTLIDVGEEWQLRERGTVPGARHITRGENSRSKPTPRKSAAIRPCKTVDRKSS